MKEHVKGEYDTNDLLFLVENVLVNTMSEMIETYYVSMISDIVFVVWRCCMFRCRGPRVRFE